MSDNVRLGGPNTRWMLTMLFLCLSYAHPSCGRAVTGQRMLPLKRASRSIQEPENIRCIDMESLSGEYWYKSTGGDGVCGFYLLGLPNQLVEVEFLDFDISCEDGGLLATLDGWETQGQIFPSSLDHSLDMDERYKTYCGLEKPNKIFVASQNVALIQYRIPIARQGFRIKIRFIENLQPCNVVSLEARGMYTLKNFGEKKNCSVSFLYPESFGILAVDVGKTGLMSMQSWETGTYTKCAEKGSGDYVEFLGGEGLDTGLMSPALNVCGLDSNPVMPPIMIGCTHSVVRLVSSGHYYNSISFMHQTFVNRYGHMVFKHCFMD